MYFGGFRYEVTDEKTLVSIKRKLIIFFILVRKKPYPWRTPTTRYKVSVGIPGTVGGGFHSGMEVKSTPNLYLISSTVKISSSFSR